MAERRRRPRGPATAAPTVPTVDNEPAGSGLVPREAAPKKYADPAPLTAEQNAAAKAAAQRRIAELTGDGDGGSVLTPSHTDNGSDSRARAAARAAEILEHDIGIEEDDKYYVPEASIPDGWKYMWRRVSVYGKEEPQYQVRVAQTGWTPVPCERHPEMMPSMGGPYLTIDRDGMRLMEIPAEVYKLLVARDHRKAIEQVRIKSEQAFKQAPPGTFERKHPENVLKHGYEPVQLPPVYQGR